ncbi:hypothetical protein M2397_002311 [Pseudomonas sp. BIGb0381]|uniref:hypothetical protein n=1 Tax=Pseudomonas sp. BIGb0381 TaxID=2940608 RepID=UPI0021674B09|nr:hypothetical protein [Pseudomonas sp. BIGb0381]MCS4312016.1 hypothetical protein [Pseudomonas sp. BIGb0381]
MSRHFNFTDRKKIDIDDVRVVLEEHENRIFCHVDIRLGAHEFPPDSMVFIEAERGRAFRHREKWGPVGVPTSGWRTGNNFDITAIGDPEGVRFRLLVVEPVVCRLLAAAENVQATSSNESVEPQQSLLPIRMDDLSGGVWALDMDGGVPILVLDIGLGSKQELKSSRILYAILPGVVRAILTNLAHEYRGDKSGDDGLDMSDVPAVWLNLGERWAGEDLSGCDTHSEIDRWAQLAANGFCKEKRLRDELAKAVRAEDS